jgi:putative sterol carrier protein
VEFLSDDWFAAANKALQDLDVGDVELTIAHVLDDTSHHLALSDGRAKVGPGTNEPDVTLSQSSEVALAVREGSLSALTAIQQGLITVEGDVGRLITAVEAITAVDEALNDLI